MRVLALAGGLAGAVSLSQFPEFSQQYVQRLSGAVDELRAVTVVFDGAASAAGLTREEALREMQSGNSGLVASVGSGIGDRIGRYERLSADYEALAPVTPVKRLANFWRFRDRELVERTWSHYQPAVPVTVDGALTAGIGFVAGWSIIAGLLALLLRPFRRRRTA
ncbi:DUF2937 family protein [Maritimibacter sp. UBA3975]|uniref:DUF2937 family protein n=1 Tax=Maritimibacter sp. UBA3975 TaxID=1946833 RepID=UPI000C0A9869|nr:DUF2937 family protein [Maritimibacter sp. UBA3975]MAM63077.1 hypothetical protein [Maritimibacter sp.]|tara:strand:+ start:34397 stop:34891 length:495 start_codon:yes stop_codon:yes gene_type:complete